MYKKTNNQAEVFISYANDKKNGGVDSYEKVATLNLKDEEAIIPLKRFNSKNKYIKVVLKTSNNTLNYWVKR